MAAIKNIIFDLGGVILNIDFKKTEEAFAALGFKDFSQYITQFHITQLFEDYETGKIEDPAFIKGIQQLCPHPVSASAIVHAWNALLLDFPPERIALLRKLKSHYRTFLLSNTNALHYKSFQDNLFQQSGCYLEDLFEKAYYSQIAKMRKPNAEIFQLVLDENGLNPSETLFIDDTASNLTGAETVGLQTFHLQKPMSLLEIPLFS
jgi:glucose-1-phosphatase